MLNRILWLQEASLTEDGKKKTEPGNTGEETVLYRARLHWASMLAPALLMLIAGLSIPTKGTNALILLAASTVWGILQAVYIQTSEIKLTKDRVLVRMGFPLRSAYSIPYGNTVGIDVYQPLLGKLIDFGRVTIFLTRKRKKSLRMIRAPYSFVSSFSEYKQAAIESEKKD